MAPHRTAAPAPRRREIAIEIEEDGPGDVARPVGIGALLRRIEVPARIDYSNVGSPEPGFQLRRRDQWFHGCRVREWCRAPAFDWDLERCGEATSRQ
jgi:hypothetical protein